MDWSDNIPTDRDRATKRSPRLPSFLTTLGWGLIAVVLWFLWAVFSPPIMQAMFGPIFFMVGLLFLCVMVAGLVLNTMWWIITGPFRNR